MTDPKDPHEHDDDPTAGSVDGGEIKSDEDAADLTDLVRQRLGQDDLADDSSGPVFASSDDVASTDATDGSSLPKRRPVADAPRDVTGVAPLPPPPTASSPGHKPPLEVSTPRDEKTDPKRPEPSTGEDAPITDIVSREAVAEEMSNAAAALDETTATDATAPLGSAPGEPPVLDPAATAPDLLPPPSIDAEKTTKIPAMTPMRRHSSAADEQTEPTRRPPPIAGGSEPGHRPPAQVSPSASAARDLYDYGALERVSFVTRFLWFCAGADAQLLMRCPNSDRVKFQGIGGVVLTVGVLAFLSGSYAFYTVFAPKDDTVLANDLVHYGAVAASVFFGLIWGLIIFNIDRFIISSTGKGDGTEKITWNEFTNALPRLLMALIIGLCMSKPLEIRILQSEIESALEKEQKEYLADLNARSESLVATERTRLREAITGLHKRIDDAEAALEKRRVEINEQRKRLEDEASGLLGGKPGRGPAWRDKKRNLDVQEEELNRDRESLNKKLELWNGELTENKTELGELDDELADAKASNAKVAQHLDGLMKRIQISHDIGGWIPFAIMLLLLCIEAGPIFFKLMIIKGAYDYLEENQKRIVRAYHGIEPDARVIADGKGKSVTVDIHHAVAAILEEEKRRLETERQLADEVHEAYRERMADKIQKDPSAFMKDQ